MKKVFEVFSNLRVSDEIFSIFKSAEVERVVSSAGFAYLKIYILSEHLINKHYIYALEKLIKDGLFAYKNIKIKIIESYRLSALYTPHNLYEAYKESILFEIRNYKILEYNILKNAEINFYEDSVQNPVMEISVEKNSLNLSVIEDLIRVLEKIFNERCGVKCRVRARYTEYRAPEYKDEFALPYKNKRESNESENSEFMQTDNAARFTSYRAESKAKSRNSESTDKFNATKDNRNLKKPVKNTFYNSNKKLSPDVLYGRDFEDNFTQLKELLGGEMER